MFGTYAVSQVFPATFPNPSNMTGNIANVVAYRMARRPVAWPEDHTVERKHSPHI